MKPRWYVYREEEPGGDAGGGGGGAESGAALPAADATIAAAPTGEVKTADMVAAIDKGLGYGDKQTPEEKAAADTKAAEDSAVKERDTKAAAGDADAIKAKTAADAAAQAEAKKPADLKLLELTPDQKKAMKAETAGRYEKVLTVAKTERARAEAAESQVQGLSQAREAIIGVLKETNTSDQDLAQLLEFNRLAKLGTPQGYEQALAVVEQQRLSLLKLLGREGQGYDPLSEHPDLAGDVAENKITKERALEIVAARKRDALSSANQNRETQAQHSQRQVTRAREQGLASIDRWAAEIARTDIDYKAKESTILAKIEGIVRDYPPNLWLPTIRTLYDSITVNKAPLPIASNVQPLRASGAKPGGPAPTSMAEAISQGLGYAKK